MIGRKQWTRFFRKMVALQGAIVAVGFTSTITVGGATGDWSPLLGAIIGSVLGVPPWLWLAWTWDT